ncbi:MAG: hypothetical protein DME93_01305 [Verrucomicrobia bacterium]|nr:MAG: hypothetical protein DME93_01305 [Verrucomicrobiota bacterium]
MAAHNSPRDESDAKTHRTLKHFVRKFTEMIVPFRGSFGSAHASSRRFRSCSDGARNGTA